MSDERLYQTMSGKAGGPFEGRTFVRVPGYMTTSRQMLADAGCDRKGPGSYLLPTGREDDLVARLDEMTVTDRDQAMKDRLPVSPEAAGGIAIGDGNSHALKILDMLARVLPVDLRLYGDDWFDPGEERRSMGYVILSPDPSRWGRSAGFRGARILHPKEVIRA